MKTTSALVPKAMRLPALGALLCLGGFAHQTLSGALYSITSDLFGKNEVATATGLGGMMGYLGAAGFTALFGVLVTQVGYSPLFVVLAAFDLIAAFVVCVLARSGDRPASRPAAGLRHDGLGSVEALSP